MMNRGKWSSILALVAAALSIGAASPQTYTGRDLVASCEDLLRHSESQHRRDAFVRQYASRVYVDEAQNQAWLDRATSSAGGLYLTMENAKLKSLNDKIIRDKDLVTALTNFHKELFLKELAATFPQTTYQVFSDFKSIHVHFVQAPSESLLVRVEAAFQSVNEKFFADPELHRIVRQEDLDSKDWFALGLGHSEDEASLAARAARTAVGFVVRFTSPSFQNLTAARLNRFWRLHETIVQRLRSLSLLESQGRVEMPPLEMFVLFRKAKSAKQLSKYFAEEFGVGKIPLDLSRMVFEYGHLADMFSPSLLNPKREVLTVVSAPFGVVSLDFLGLGAENLRATARALARAHSLNEALRLARQGEASVTKAFLARKAAVAKGVRSYFEGEVSIRFSGDDGIIIPGREMTLKDQLLLLKQLSGIEKRPFFRMSTISPDGAQSGQTSQLISQAESIEKALRPLIKSKMGAEISRKIHINVFNTEENGVNKVYLILRLKMKFSQEQTQVMYSLFNKALRSVERDLQAQGQEIRFIRGDIFATGR